MGLNRFMQILSILTAMVVISVFGYIFYLMTYPFDIVTLREFSVPARVNQGEPVPYTLEFDKHLNYKPNVRYYVTNPNRSPLEIITSSVNRPTEAQTVKLALAVPSSLEVGCNYQIQVDIEYTIIFYRTIPYTWTSNEFCIINP